MSDATFPNSLQGQWIWNSPESDDCYLTYNFSLNEIPASADFWYSVGEFCHIYVNGMHLSYGPGSATHGLM